MNEWEIAAVVLAAGLLPCLAVCALLDPADALVALEIAGILLSTILMALAEGLQRQPFIDLALVFAMLATAGALVFARMLEHDL